MNKSILWLIVLLFVASFSIVSCSESDGTEDAYANWEERNQRYIDSIATVAEANLGEDVGQWKIIRSYKLGSLGLNETGKVNEYVYCKIIWKGDGDVRPLFTDTVGVDFRGKLIDGTVFSQNYTGELEPNLEFIMPSNYPYVEASGRVRYLGTGAKTATMQMHVGDRWEVYIPYDLGYGEEGNDDIPGYSTLIFDWYLADIIPLKGTERSLEGLLEAE